MEAVAEFIRTNKIGDFEIRGDPGIGKSALAGQLVKINDYIHHFNVRAMSCNTPEAFLRNICAQLISAYDLPYQSLPAEAARYAGFLSSLLGETLATVPRGIWPTVTGRELTSSGDTPLAVALPRRTPRFLGPGNDTQLGAECISQRRDQREFRPHLARGEQAPHARGVAVDAPRQLGFGYAQVSPKRVELPDHRISLGKLPRRLLIRRTVLRVLHPPIPAALMQADIDHLRGHGRLPSKCCAGDTINVPPMQHSVIDRHSVASRDRCKGFALASGMRTLAAAQARRSFGRSLHGQIGVR